MKMRFKTIGTLSALVLAVTFLATLNAEAHAPRSREMSVTIQTINHDRRILVVDGALTRCLSELVWNSGTTFIHDRKFAPATELKAGTRAKVFYRSPFFGKPFVTKVVWENGH